MIQKILAGAFGGLILALLAANNLTCLFAPAEKDADTTWVTVTFLCLIWFPAIFISIFYNTRAPLLWRRFLIASALCSFALPLTAFIGALRIAHALTLSGHFSKDTNDAIAVFAGSLTSILVGVLGFFLGAIFLTMGLLVGREKREASSSPVTPPAAPQPVPTPAAQPCPVPVSVPQAVDDDRRYYENCGRK